MRNISRPHEQVSSQLWIGTQAACAPRSVPSRRKSRPRRVWSGGGEARSRAEAEFTGLLCRRTKLCAGPSLLASLGWTPTGRTELEPVQPREAAVAGATAAGVYARTMQGSDKLAALAASRLTGGHARGCLPGGGSPPSTLSRRPAPQGRAPVPATCCHTSWGGSTASLALSTSYLTKPEQEVPACHWATSENSLLRVVGRTAFRSKVSPTCQGWGSLGSLASQPPPPTHTQSSTGVGGGGGCSVAI